MYKLTSTSLYAAASVELKKDDIIRLLDKFSKNMVVPVQVDEMIEEHTRSYGKAKLVLQDNKYYIEAEKEMMDRLLKIEVISAAQKKAHEQDQQGVQETTADVTLTLGQPQRNIDQKYEALRSRHLLE